MENQKINKFEKNIFTRIEELNNFLDGDMVNFHEYKFDDPQFKIRVCQLHQLANALYAATFI